MLRNIVSPGNLQALGLLYPICISQVALMRIYTAL